MSSLESELLSWLEAIRPETGEKVRSLLASGARAESPGQIPMVFFALRHVNVAAVRALLEGGASLDAALPSDWTEADDEGENVLATAGTTARQYWAQFEKQERADEHLPPKRLRWLDQMAALVGSEAPKGKSAGKASAPSKGAKAGEAKPSKPTKASDAQPSKAQPSKTKPSKAEPSKAEPNKASKSKAEGFDGKWHEVRFISPSRRGPVKEGGVLTIRGDAFTRDGSIRAGLPRKGKLTVRGQARAYVDEDLEWSITLSKDTLTITSPAEADEEHGFVFTSILERVVKPPKG